VAKYKIVLKLKSHFQLSRTLLRPLTFTRPLKSAGLHGAHVHPTKKAFAKRHVPHWTERDARPRPLLGKIICVPARHSLYKVTYQIWSL